jgi:hypothetical protein
MLSEFHLQSTGTRFRTKPRNAARIA